MESSGSYSLKICGKSVTYDTKPKESDCQSSRSQTSSQGNDKPDDLIGSQVLVMK